MVSWILIGVVIILLYTLFNLSKFKHDFFSVVLVIFLIFLAFGAVMVFRGKNIDVGSLDGLKKASSIYLGWLGGVWDNTKTITSNAVRLDWRGDSQEKNSTKTTQNKK